MNNLGPYLMRIRLKTNETVWYWAHDKKGKPFSPVFKRQKEAQEWIDNFISVHSEMLFLIDRAKNGKFYNVKAIIDNDTVEDHDYPPFNITIDANDNSIGAKILATSLEEARSRFSEYYDVLEWVE